MMQFVWAAVMVTVVFLLCAGGGVAQSAQKVDISSKLSGLDVLEGLKEVISAMHANFQN